MSEPLTHVELREGGGTRGIPVEAGSTLLEALILAGGAQVDASCAGRGRCGRCRVRASGALSAPDGRELSLLSRAELEEGWRLACLARVEGPARIERLLPAAASILAEGPSTAFLPDPPARWLRLALAPPELEEQLADEERLHRALAVAHPAGFPGPDGPARLGLAAVRGLATAARGGELQVLLRGGEVIAVDPPPAAGGSWLRSLGLGVDIGTTTVVAYLIDLADGSLLGTGSGLNEQRSFGADVISRIQACIERPTGLEELRSRITGQLSSLARDLLLKAGAREPELVSIAVAGNTTMLHLLAGVWPAAIAASPFPPVFAAGRVAGAAELGLDLAPTTSVHILPCLAGYVGADILAGIAALGMAEREGCSLLLDIGTNGELALGDSRGILACATAAGPAFEGAGISMGMGGVEGAIDSVWIEEGGESLLGSSTIGGLEARGLCGSGVLDALAVFLELGLVDGSGRILDAEEAAVLGAAIAALREESSEGPRLRVREGIWLSQADVRQLQLATAAIAAGIELLLLRSGRRIDEVERVYLAGGFGSFMDLRSAVRVGLVPGALADRLVVVGNSSGAGAAAACLSRARLAACETARSRCSYVELSSSPEFNDAFVEHLFFPEFPEGGGGMVR